VPRWLVAYYPTTFHRLRVYGRTLNHLIIFGAPVASTAEDKMPSSMVPARSGELWLVF